MNRERWDQRLCAACGLQPIEDGHHYCATCWESSTPFALRLRAEKRRIRGLNRSSQPENTRS